MHLLVFFPKKTIIIKKNKQTNKQKDAVGNCKNIKDSKVKAKMFYAWDIRLIKLQAAVSRII